jgi:S-DNA-T family DNA segregation ATPase FtsK/SpoIIIE
MANKKKSTVKKTTAKTSSVKRREFPKHKWFGGAMMFFSVFAFLASISYLFSWQADQSLLDSSVTDFVTESQQKNTRNIMGKLGALLGHVLVFKGFGIGGILFLPIIFMSGLNAYFRKTYKVNVDFALISITSGILLSIITAIFFYETNPTLSGVLGYNLFQFLRSGIGLVGLVLLLIAVIGVFLYMYLNIDFLTLFQKKNNDEKEQESEMTKKRVVVGTEESLFEKDKIEIGDNDDKVDADFEIIDQNKNVDNEKIDHNDENEKVDDGVEFTVTETNSNSKSITPEIEKEENITDKKEHHSIDEPYDPKLDLRDYEFPKIDFLKNHGGDSVGTVTKTDLSRSKDLIVNTLANYKIGISKITATIGPTVTLFEIVPAAGVRISKIKNLEDDIALSLAALGIRIIAPIPGKGTIGIEVPNKSPEVVSMRSVIESDAYKNTKYDLPVCLGKTISNEVFVADLARMPHLLMAGATGQGKSVGLNAILVSLLYKKHPSELKLVLVDPKKVELTIYHSLIRHFLAKLPNVEDAIITDNSQVINTLNSLCVEMDERYALLQQAMVRNIKEYNQKFIDRKLNPNDGHKYLPYIVVVIDEVADLIMTAGKEVEHPIGRLAQLARAIGIHLILATQRPSVNIITGTIKANFPARAAFRVSSKIDSRTILDGNGADQLIGKGDMLYSTGSEMVRLQCPFVDTPEVDEIASFIGSQRGYPIPFELPEVSDDTGSGSDLETDPNERDAMFEDAARIVVLHQQGSTSLIQRKLKVGYNRAGRLMDQLEANGIVGPFEGSKARQVLIPDEYALEQFLNQS